MLPMTHIMVYIGYASLAVIHRIGYLSRPMIRIRLAMARVVAKKGCGCCTCCLRSRHKGGGLRPPPHQWGPPSAAPTDVESFMVAAEAASATSSPLFGHDSGHGQSDTYHRSG